MRQQTDARPKPCSIVIFGASGDLAQRKLLPALYNLMLDGLLPERCAVLGIGRTPLDDAGYRKMARKAVHEFSRRDVKSDVWNRFEPKLFYITGDIDDSKTFLDARRRLAQIEAKLKLPGNRIF